jgi:hypothetical protein
MTAPALLLGAQLRRLAEDGVAVVPGAVPLSTLGPLLDELDTLPFAAPPPDALPMAAGSELAVLQGWSGCYPALTALRRDLVGRIRRAGHGIRGLPGWRPNEIFVRRYHPASTGMSPHVDGVRFRYLVATLTVCGTATFRVHDDAGAVHCEWDVEPGDLVLIRGPGLAGIADGRPRHSVGPPGSHPRCSAAFRMNSQLNGRA